MRRSAPVRQSCIRRLVRPEPGCWRPGDEDELGREVLERVCGRPNVEATVQCNLLGGQPEPSRTRC